LLQLGSTLSPTTIIISSFLLETSTMLGDLCFFFFIFARVLYSFFIFENHPVIRGSNSKNSGAGNIRESLLLNHQRLPSSSPSFYRPRLFLHRFSPTFDPSYTFFFFFFARLFSASFPAPSLRTAPGGQRMRVGYQRRRPNWACRLSELQWGAGVVRAKSEVKMEALRKLEELVIEFPGKNIYRWNLFQRPTYYDFFTQQRFSTTSYSRERPPVRNATSHVLCTLS